MKYVCRTGELDLMIAKCNFQIEKFAKSFFEECVHTRLISMEKQTRYLNTRSQYTFTSF